VIQAIPLSDALGVELVDFDIRQPCGPDDQSALRRLFCEHHLLLVRGQSVSPEDQTRFVGFFGPVRDRGDDNAGAFVSNRGGRPAGAGTGKRPGRLLWHSDGVYGPRPGIATSLLAQEVWPESVPTMFASGARAYAQLPVALRDRVDGLHALFLRDLLVERTDVRLREEDIPEDEPERFTKFVHPVVWLLPHADQRVLLINELATSHIIELPRDESEALLHDLFSRMYAGDNVYTHSWRNGDLIIWDNQALQHSRPDMGDVPRHLRRQSLDGWYTDHGLLEWEETAYGPDRAA
jgi:taurine dioxygenase